MLEYMLSFLKSWFANPSAVGIGLAIGFGAIWFAAYWTPILRNWRAWAVLVGSAFLALIAVVFVQLPLQFAVGDLLGRFWSQEVLVNMLLLTAIPQILLSGLVQEGAKLVPVVVWWRRAGFGMFEAQWAHNTIFTFGWTWQAVETGGFWALAPFWERFFAVAFHTASSALAGWGLARGWGWQFYLVASVFHAVLNYSAVLLNRGLLTIIQLEIYAAAIAVLVTAIVLWLRWRKSEETFEAESGV